MNYAALFVTCIMLTTSTQAQLLFIDEVQAAMHAEGSARLHLGDDAVLTGVAYVPYTEGGNKAEFEITNCTAQAWLTRYTSSSTGKSEWLLVLKRSATSLSIISPADVLVNMPLSELESCRLLTAAQFGAKSALASALHHGLMLWLQQHPSAKITFAALFNNSCQPSGDVRGTFWRFDATDGDETYRCYVDANNNSIVHSGVVTSLTGTEDSPSDLTFDIFPNPAQRATTNKLHVSIMNPHGMSIAFVLTDSAGRTIASHNFGTGVSGVYPVQPALGTSLPSGRYVATIVVGGRSISKALLLY